VLCFLHWHNVKESSSERIHSPLLLLPVELTKKKGVRDSYVLDPTTSEAEVNPALRHHLKELYNLSLPESVDLREMSLDQFYEGLKAQILSSEPAVAFNKVDLPRIELIHERARQRVDQYRRRLKLKARVARSTAKPEYSYDRDRFRPLGLQLFLEKVRPAPMPLSDAAGAAPQPRAPNIADPGPPPEEAKVLEVERPMFTLKGNEEENPYSWDFDLCSQTLGNFNYRKMTLVRDYARLIETDMASAAFDTIFALTPRPIEPVPEAKLDLADQHLVIACDSSQAAAIARARTGASFIIQGPPGTGKSQTITNLIADYVARGQRVLFVCEKRAAIDVVFHRLRQQGLDELCCLIHDSQTDKKAFIQDLKETYERFSSPGKLDADCAGKRARALGGLAQDLATLRAFSNAMECAYEATGLPLRSLLHRLVEICGHAPARTAEIEEALPEYPLWLRHGDVVNRLRVALQDAGEDLCFANHPLRWLGSGVLLADGPLEALASGLVEAEELLETIKSELESAGLPGQLWESFAGIHAVLDFARRALPLAERELLGILARTKASKEFDALTARFEHAAHALRVAQENASAWRDPLSAFDTQSALEQARSFQKSLLRFVQPAYWRLRKTVHSRYDFTRHAVAPSIESMLSALLEVHQAKDAMDALYQETRQLWHTDDVDAIRALAVELRKVGRAGPPTVTWLVEQLARSEDAGSLIANLASIDQAFARLDETLGFLLAEHRQSSLPDLKEVLATLREQTELLPELLPVLAELTALPDRLCHALRHAAIPLDQFEGALGGKSVNLIYRHDRALRRFDGRALTQALEKLAAHYREWLDQNGHCIKSAVRRKFADNAAISSLPASQLDAQQKTFKKKYAAGRRGLEHEFGKTIRYKSIRDLAASDAGAVIQDLKPVWLMSPLSVSDTLPLDPSSFDVVIFDEASQIPLEEAIPAIYRSHQVIVVGDAMQLPPTTFFATGRVDDDSVVVEEDGQRTQVDLDSDSFLTQSATSLPATLLTWHYRSRFESLISFSNAAFYGGSLLTIPDRQRPAADQPELRVPAPDQAAAGADALLGRSISFHFMENGLYLDRRNPSEAVYIAGLVRELLRRQTGFSMGVVAFSQAQQAEIEDALNQLAQADAAFAVQLEAEFVREALDQFCGLFIKNLENVQGDERDIILISVCYGPDANRRIKMNFGPINQRGGEKRLNVIFSRARQHLAVISSIRHHHITNDHNDGANTLKNYLQYAEATSKGDIDQARHVLENLSPLARKALAPASSGDAVVAALALALRARGYAVDRSVGQSRFRCDLAVRSTSSSAYRLGILVDTSAHYGNPDLLDRYLMQPTILRAFGWRCALVLTKDWYQDPGSVLSRLERLLDETPPG
jgi:hypothetical protein